MSSQTDFAQLLILFANDVLIFLVSFFIPLIRIAFTAVFLTISANRLFSTKLQISKETLWTYLG